MKYVLIFVTLILCSAKSHALIITSDATIENSTLVVDYTFTADQVDIDFFSVFFDATLFDNIQVLQNPSPLNWDAFAVQSDNFFGVLDDGFVDFEALLAPLAIGESVSGFQISADIIDGSAIDNLLANGFTQDFIVFDIFTFDEVLAGTVQIDVQAVSAPSVFALFALGLFAAATRRTQ